MKVLENESLKKYTTIKIGGIAEKMFFPEDQEELINIVKKTHGELYIISGGSNLLINDERVFNTIINLKLLDNKIENLGDGKFYVGASVSLQKLILQIYDESYGGIEFLFSVPALVGGAIAMNAGRGKSQNINLGDFISEVKVYDIIENKVIILKKDECKFGYRTSIFKERKLIILGAIFSFEKGDKDKLKLKREERIQLVRKKQDNSGYNFGSVFREYNKFIMHIIRLLSRGKKNGVKFSSITANWLINNGDGTYKQAKKLIERTIKIHRMMRQNVKLEVIMWD
jgi:UDP-N-acetylmuramate dehydrogenase